MGPVWYTSKTWKIPIKLWHSAATTAESSLRIWVFSNTILMIQLQKVSEKSETMMRVTGLDLVESATILRNHNQRGFKHLKDSWLILKDLVKMTWKAKHSGWFHQEILNLQQTTFVTCWMIIQRFGERMFRTGFLYHKKLLSLKAFREIFNILMTVSFGWCKNWRFFSSECI